MRDSHRAGNPDRDAGRLLRILLGLLMTSASGAPVAAATISWNNSSGGNWSVASNWTPAQVPGAFDTAVITLASTYTVTLDVDATVAGLTVGGASGVQTFQISFTTLTLNGPGQFGTRGVLDFSGGTITGPGNLTLDGPFSWTGGVLQTGGAPGTVVTSANAGISMTGFGGRVLLERRLQTAGTTTWMDSGSIQVGLGGEIRNAGLWDVQTDGVLQNFFGGSALFTNTSTGTLRKSAGAGTMLVVIPFDNGGTVDVRSGTLYMLGGGSATGSFTGLAGQVLDFGGGTYSMSGGAGVGGPLTVRFSGATVTFAPGSAYTVTGPTQIAGGEAIFNSPLPISIADLEISGGTLDGSADVNVSGSFTWTGGIMRAQGASGTPVTTAAAGVAFGGGGGPAVLERRLQTAGTTTWMDSGSIQVGLGGEIRNAGLWDVQTDGVLQNFFGGSALFTNTSTGTFRKSAGAGTMLVGIPFDNGGSVDVRSGTLYMLSGGSTTGSFTGLAGQVLDFGAGTYGISGGAGVGGPLTVRFSGATVTFAPGSSYNVTGSTQIAGGEAIFNSSTAISMTSLDFSGGTLDGSADVNVSGSFTWDGGWMRAQGVPGTPVTTAASGIVFSGVNQPAVLERRLQTAGTTTLTGASGIQVGLGGEIRNTGLWDAQSDAAIQNFFGGSALFTNTSTGTFRKSAGAGISSTGIPFSNAGTVRALAGTLAYSGGYVQTGGATILNGGSLTSTTTLQIQGGSLEGFGIVTANVVSAGRVGPGLSPGTLAIAGSYTQSAGGLFDVETGGLTPGTQHDRFNITSPGVATLAGTLKVTLIGGFVPQVGNSFTVMTFPSRSGQFGNFRMPRLAPGLGWQVVHNPASVVLNVISGVCLDNDGDDFVACGGCTIGAGQMCGECNDMDPTIHPGAQEICDGVDQDCDGLIDEGFSGIPETCNGLDDNCNGLVDEGNPGGGAFCGTGELGVCGDGTVICESGSLTCRRNSGPGPELCNGLDDDCDGDIDETSDNDGDGLENCSDNCPDAFNPPSDCDGNPATPDEQCDADNDGKGDVCDCSPNDPLNGPPPEVGDNLIVLPTGPTQISWGAVPSVNQYNLYRGYFTVGSPWAYNQQCLLSNLGGSSATDALDPRSFTLFYYVASSNCAGFAESPLARSSSGSPIPQPFACPALTLDDDGDGTEEAADNCPGFQNPSQSDVDADAHGDVCDNCPATFNPTQSDLDGDGLGDVCDPDRDGDGILEDGDGSGIPGDHPCVGGNTFQCDDNCPNTPNPSQADADMDGIGDACDPS